MVTSDLSWYQLIAARNCHGETCSNLNSYCYRWTIVWYCSEKGYLKKDLKKPWMGIVFIWLGNNTQKSSWNLDIIWTWKVGFPSVYFFQFWRFFSYVFTLYYLLEEIFAISQSSIFSLRKTTKWTLLSHCIVRAPANRCCDHKNVKTE